MNSNILSINATYILLLILTLFSYFVTESNNSSSNLAIVALPVAGIKFYTIYLEYMGMKNSHIMWKVLILFFLFVTILPILIFLQ